MTSVLDRRAAESDHRTGSGTLLPGGPGRRRPRPQRPSARLCAGRADARRRTGRAGRAVRSRTRPRARGVVHGRPGLQHRQRGAAVHPTSPGIRRRFRAMGGDRLCHHLRRPPRARRPDRRHLRPAVRVHPGFGGLLRRIAGCRPDRRCHPARHGACPPGHRSRARRAGVALAHHRPHSRGPPSHQGSRPLRRHRLHRVRGRAGPWRRARAVHELALHLLGQRPRRRGRRSPGPSPPQPGQAEARDRPPRCAGWAPHHAGRGPRRVRHLRGTDPGVGPAPGDRRSGHCWRRVGGVRGRRAVPRRSPHRPPLAPAPRIADGGRLDAAGRGLDGGGARRDVRLPPADPARLAARGRAGDRPAGGGRLRDRHVRRSARPPLRPADLAGGGDGGERRRLPGPVRSPDEWPLRRAVRSRGPHRFRHRGHRLRHDRHGVQRHGPGRPGSRGRCGEHDPPGRGRRRRGGSRGHRRGRQCTHRCRDSRRGSERLVGGGGGGAHRVARRLVRRTNAATRGTHREERTCTRALQSTDGKRKKGAGK